MSCKQFIHHVDTAVNDKMFGQKYGPKKMTLEKPLIGGFRLPRVRPGGKAPNRELPPKSGDITCMPTSEPSRRDDSDEGSEHMVSMRNKKKYL